jgi:hypothetical protein
VQEAKVTRGKEELDFNVERLQQRLQAMETKIERCRIQMKEPVESGLGAEDRQKLIELQVHDCLKTIRDDDTCALHDVCDTYSPQLQSVNQD